LFTARILPALIPAVCYFRLTLAKRPAVSDRVWVAVGIVGWVAIQIVLLAYGRGTLVAPRYMDILLLVYPVGLVAVLALADRARATRFRRYAGPGAVTSVLVLVAVVAALGYWGSLRAMDFAKSARGQEVAVQSYLATGNVSQLRPQGGPG